MPAPLRRAREGSLPGCEGGGECSLRTVRGPCGGDHRGRGKAGPCTECADNSIGPGRRFRSEESSSTNGARRDLGAVCEDRAENPVHGVDRGRVVDLLAVACIGDSEGVFGAQRVPHAVAVCVPDCEVRANSWRRAGCNLRAGLGRVRPERADTHEPQGPTRCSRCPGFIVMSRACDLGCDLSNLFYKLPGFLCFLMAPLIWVFTLCGLSCYEHLTRVVRCSRFSRRRGINNCHKNQGLINVCIALRCAW